MSFLFQNTQATGKIENNKTRKLGKKGKALTQHLKQ
jgi:hypothetical protein